MKNLLVILCLLTLSVIYGQTTKYDLSDILSSLDEDYLNEYTLNLLEEVFQTKLDLNQINLRDKKKLIFIDERLLDTIIKYRNVNGVYKSINDLYKIPDINPNELKKLIPFLKLDVNKVKESYLDLVPNFSSRIRFFNKNKIDFPDKIYSRIQVLNTHYNIYSILNKSSNASPQLNNISINITPNEFVHNIIIGEYNINFGLGLTLWGPYKLFKGRYFNAIRKNSSVLKKYSSANIENSLSGAGITLNHKNIFTTLFYSKKNVINKLFDTENKIKRQHIGGIIKYISNETEFELLIQKYDFFSINNQTKSFLTIGLTSKYLFNNYIYENEFSYYSNNLSQVHTLKYRPVKNFTVFYLIRSYKNLFEYGYANPIRESSSIRNEFGQMFCMEYKLNKTKYLLYIDKYEIESKLNHNIYLSGLEYIGVISHKFDKKLELISSIKYENKERLLAEIESINLIENVNLQFKNELKFKITNYFKLQQRIDISKHLNNSNTYSFSISSRINYSLPEIINLIMAVTYFKIPEGSLPIYLYEYDLPGLFTNRRLIGDGFSWYCLTKLRLLNSLLLSIKYSQYTELNHLKINNYSKQIIDLKIQIDLKI